MHRTAVFNNLFFYINLLQIIYQIFSQRIFRKLFGKIGNYLENWEIICDIREKSSKILKFLEILF
jgi:hypothetical protein